MSSTVDRVLAKPSGECCLKAVQHTGDPAGETVTISNIETYVSQPPEKSSNTGQQEYQRILLHYPDVHGPFFINNKLVSDYYASRGKDGGDEGDLTYFHLTLTNRIFGGLARLFQWRPGNST
jgi:hypothetical protein